MNKYERGARIWYQSLIALCLLTGCATQMPVTEGLVFTDEESISQSGSSFSEGISGEMTVERSLIVPHKNFQEALANEFGETATDYEIERSFLTSFSLPSFAVFYRNRIGLGSTVPLIGFWQMDGTVRFFNHYFLTLNKKFSTSNTEVILQRRFFYRNQGGVSLGAFYRYDPFELKNNGTTESRFHISSFGLRSVFQTPKAIGWRLHLRGFINAGYAPEIDTPVISLGISLGARFEN